MDCGLANNDWLWKFSSSKIHHLQFDSSDHCPLWIIPNSLEIPCITKPIKFQEMWLLDCGCSDDVEVVWYSNEVADPAIKVIRKLEKCGKELGRRNRNHFGNVKETWWGHKGISRKGSLEFWEQFSVRELKQEITDLIVRENKLWFQRSKVLWAKFGDRNSKFSHIHASQRMRKNSIQKIRDIHGVWRSGKEGIADCLVEYYQELFSSTNLEHCDTTINSIQKIISLEMNSQLSTEFMEWKWNKLLIRWLLLRPRAGWYAPSLLSAILKFNWWWYFLICPPFFKFCIYSWEP